MKIVNQSIRPNQVSHAKVSTYDNIPHVLFLTDTLDGMGGAERNLLLLSQSLRSRGFQVSVACLKGGEIAGILKKDGFPVYVLNVGRVYGVMGIMGICKILYFIRKNNISTVLTYHESSDVMGALITLLSRVPVVSSRRDLGFNLTWRTLLFYRGCNRLYAGIIAVSEAVKEAVIKTQKIDSSQVTTIYNGINFQGSRSIDKIDITHNPGPHKTKINMCCIANIRPIKGHEYLLEAIRLVKNECSEFCLYLVGKFDKKDNYYQKLQKEIHEWDLEDNVVFTGGIHCDAVFGFLEKMDISVLASLSEGMPNTLLESMAVGLPVVATAVGGSSEVVKHGETGFLVPAKNVEKLADALLHLIQNSSVRKVMGRNAEGRYRNFFTIKRMVDRYEDFLKYAIIKRKRRNLYRKWAREELFFTLKQSWKCVVANILFYTKLIYLYTHIRGILNKGKVIILCLHDVVGAESKWLMFYIATFSGHFSKIIDTVKQYSEVVSLETACAILEKNHSFKRDVIAITFDDCYSSFNGTVFEKCSQAQIPFTIFLNTYPLDNKKLLLHDVLIYLITSTWRKVVYFPQIANDVFLLDTKKSFRSFVEVIFKKLQKRSFVEWNDAVNELALYLEVNLQDEQLEDIFLSWDDVHHLHASGVTIGAHTITHPLLTSVSDEECFQEICGSKQRIERKLNTEIQFFSYPYGHRKSYNKKVEKVVAQCGFRFAFTLKASNKYSTPLTISRKNVSPGQFLSGNGSFSRPLFELELSGLGDFVFGRWLDKFRASK